MTKRYCVLDEVDEIRRIVHMSNRISPEFTACGINARSVPTDWSQRHLHRDPTVTCENCKRTRLYHGDATNAINKLTRKLNA